MHENGYRPSIRHTLPSSDYRTRRAFKCSPAKSNPQMAKGRRQEMGYRSTHQSIRLQHTHNLNNEIQRNRKLNGIFGQKHSNTQTREDFKKRNQQESFPTF